MIWTHSSTQRPSNRTAALLRSPGIDLRLAGDALKAPRRLGAAEASNAARCRLAWASRRDRRCSTVGTSTMNDGYLVPPSLALSLK